ncbi:MAG: hypothetical protein RJA05_441 [Planctomycetota bacterium]
MPEQESTVPRNGFFTVMRLQLKRSNWIGRVSRIFAGCMLAFRRAWTVSSFAELDEIVSRAKCRRCGCALSTAGEGPRATADAGRAWAVLMKCPRCRRSSTMVFVISAAGESQSDSSGKGSRRSRREK